MPGESSVSSRDRAAPDVGTGRWRDRGGGRLSRRAQGACWNHAPAGLGGEGFPAGAWGSVGQGVAGLFDGLADLLGRHGLLGGDPDLARGEVDLDIGDALDGREFLGH
jgi:hypothetical protein